MHLHVFSKGDGCCKALTALRASVGLVWQMNHLMRLKAEGINNIFAHDLNSRGNIGLFFHVNFHVLLEAGFHSETLSTVNTDVWIEVLVDLKVLVKICYAAKNLPTLIALQTMSFMYDYTILRLHCQLPTMVRLYFNHMLTFCLKKHLSQQGLVPRCFDFCSRETVHLAVFHLNVIMVCLGYNCIDAGYSSEVRSQSLDL